MYALLGGTGYVGTAFQKHLNARSIPFRVLSRRELDYYDRAVLKSALQEMSATALINAAGFTGRPNVDACEIQKTDCLAGNGVLPGIVRDVCDDLALPWGHVSSGCIFTGRRADGAGFTEADAPNFSFRQDNCSFYSGCKALGEEVLADAERCYVWRLRIPFDNIDSSRNFISKLMRYQRLLVAENSLSHLEEYVASCVACLTKNVDYGIYNLTNPGSVNSRDVVAMIQKHGMIEKSFEFFDSEEEFMQIAAKTPRSNCVLDSSKAVAAGLPLSPVDEALDKAMSTWVPEA